MANADRLSSSHPCVLKIPCLTIFNALVSYMIRFLENKTIIVRFLVMKICPGFDSFKGMLIIARKLNHDEYSKGFFSHCTLHVFFFTNRGQK